MNNGMDAALRRVLKRLRYPLDVMLLCVRSYVAYPLSLRNLEEMMSERGILVDHSTVHRWALKLLPVLEKLFRRRKAPVRQELAHGRNVHQDRRPVAIPVPGRGQGPRHGRIPAARPS